MKTIKMLKNDIYLDNSATSRFKPLGVWYAMSKSLLHSSNPGRSSHKDTLTMLESIEAARMLITDNIGSGNVIFTKNCTEALNLAILGGIQDGEVITTVLEHNSVYRPLNHLKRIGKINLKIIYPNNNYIYTASILEKSITSKTKYLVINEMSNVLGVIQPIEEIALLAKAKGITLIVDTAQSMGHIKTNYTNVDMVATSGHKGLHSPQGIGFLRVKEHIKLNPISFGGTGTDSLSLDQPHDFPEGYESGTLNTPGILGLYNGMKFTFKHFEKINNHINKLSHLLIDKLSDISDIKILTPKDNYNGVVSFLSTKFPSGEIGDILNRDYNIAVRTGLHCAPLIHRYLNTISSGLVRVSIGYNNSKYDINNLVKAIIAINK